VNLYLEGRSPVEKGVSAEQRIVVYLEGRAVCRTECTCLPGRKECLQNRVKQSTWKEGSFDAYLEWCTVQNRVKLSP
jgi:hypothetical protein